MKSKRWQWCVTTLIFISQAQAAGSSHASPSPSRPSPSTVRSVGAVSPQAHMYPPQDSLAGVGGDVQEAFAQGKTASVFKKLHDTQMHTVVCAKTAFHKLWNSAVLMHFNKVHFFCMINFHLYSDFFTTSTHRKHILLTGQTCGLHLVLLHFLTSWMISLLTCFIFYVCTDAEDKRTSHELEMCFVSQTCAVYFNESGRHEWKQLCVM